MQQLRSVHADEARVVGCGVFCVVDGADDKVPGGGAHASIAGTNASSGALAVVGSTFAGNTAGYGGGGMYAQLLATQSSIAFDDVIVCDNVAHSKLSCGCVGCFFALFWFNFTSKHTKRYE